MKDGFGRTIDYLRVSLTDRCNLRCAYCMPADGVELLPHGEILTIEETLRICGVFVGLGVDRFKVTGGEPLVRRGAVQLIEVLRSMPGVRQVTVTTNGLLLEEHLPSLVAAGIDGLNISLDTLDAAVFRTLAGVDGLAQTLRAIDRAADSGIPVKLNCVPVRGVNEDELCEIAALARERVRAVRFIELMPMGLAARFEGVSHERVRALLEAAYGPLTTCGDRLGNGPAQYYALEGFAGRIGLIGALTHSFCGDCNRVRLTADGRLRLCLAHDAEADLKTPLRGGATDAQLAELIRRALAGKPRMHEFAQSAAGQEFDSMYAIGG